MGTYDELGIAMLGLDPQANESYDVWEERLWEEYEITADQFDRLVDRILDFTPTMQTMITRQEMHVLGVHDGKGFVGYAQKPVVKTDAETEGGD